MEEDGTVRNSNGQLIQFRYGADGWDACYMVRVFLADLNFPFTRFLKKHLESDDSTPYFMSFKLQRGNHVHDTPENRIFSRINRIHTLSLHAFAGRDEP